MAATSIVEAFGSKMGSLADAVRAKALVSGPLTIEAMTSAIESIDDQGAIARAIVEGQQIDLSLPVSKVRPDAFIRHYSVTSVNLPSASTVGFRAFQECVNLSQADMPSATLIESSAFQGCNSLESASAPLAAEIRTAAFINCTSLKEASFPECSTLGAQAFQGCTDLSSASFPELSNVPQSAFQGCTDLKDAFISEATAIGSSAFMNCTELKSIEANAWTFWNSAFWNCQKLSKAVLPNAGNIASSAFASCYRLTELDLCGVSAIPTLSNANAFASTPLYNYSNYAGGWGSIYVPESLYAGFRTAGNWSYMSNRMVSMSAIPGALVDAFGNVELAHSTGVELTSSDNSGGTVSMELSKSSAGDEGFCIELSNLSSYAQYVLLFSARFTGSFDSVASHRTGFRVFGTPQTNYYQSTVFRDNMERDSEWHSYSMPFLAKAGGAAHLAFALDGLADSSEATLEISGMEVREAVWE